MLLQRLLRNLAPPREAEDGIELGQLVTEGDLGRPQSRWVDVRVYPERPLTYSRGQTFSL